MRRLYETEPVPPAEEPPDPAAVRRGGLIALTVAAIVLAILAAIALDCCSPARAQDRPVEVGQDHLLDPPMVVESPSTTVERPWWRPVTLKETALMAARVAVNEAALRTFCVPWERRPGCKNDLGAIIQRARAAALRANRSVYDELRRHSPWATGLCVDMGWEPYAWEDEAIWSVMPRRCRRHEAPGGNVRWTSTLGVDFAETPAWRAVNSTLPWYTTGHRPEPPRATWERVVRDALRLLEEDEPWSPCAQDPIAWAGTIDAIPTWMAVVDCGPTRNRYTVAAGREPPEDSPTVPAGLAGGRRGRR